MKMRKRNRSKKIKYLLLLLLVIGAWTGKPRSVLAAADASFGSQSYSPLLGQEFPMGVYIKAEETIASGEAEIRYDPQMLEYISGGQLAEEGRIRLSYENVGTDRGRRDIRFRAKTGGRTEVSIQDVKVWDISGNSLDIISLQTAPVNIPIPETCRLAGIKLNGKDMSFQNALDLEFYGEVPSEVEKAEIQVSPVYEGTRATVTETALEEGENTIRILVTDGDGRQAAYTAKVTRQKIQEPEETEGETDQAGEEFQEETGKAVSSDRRLLLAGVFFLLLEILLCASFLIRIYEKRKKRKARKKQKQHVRLKHRQEVCDGNDWEIQVKDVTMIFRISRNPSSSVKEYLIKKLKKEAEYMEFAALDHVSFGVKKGEVVGIIGTNGSGKSTLLKIISGALVPTRGEVRVDKRKIQLLTLGTGFDQELTGRENVYLNGALIGYTKEYIDENYDRIVAFAELERFMDEKVKNYSSGMVSRLGFAIATMRDTPEILILDEVLSVGDMFFRKKSEERIREMIHGGSTVLLVSHSMDVIRKNCDKVVWIEKGILKMVGKPEEVCPAYVKQHG